MLILPGFFIFDIEADARIYQSTQTCPSDQELASKGKTLVEVLFGNCNRGLPA